MPRRRNVPGMQESKTQEARIAALLARPRTHYPAARCFPSAEISLFCGLKTPRYHPTWPGAVAGTRPSLRTLTPLPPAARWSRRHRWRSTPPFCYGKDPSRSTWLSGARGGAAAAGRFRARRRWLSRSAGGSGMIFGRWFSPGSHHPRFAREKSSAYSFPSSPLRPGSVGARRGKCKELPRVSM